MNIAERRSFLKSAAVVLAGALVGTPRPAKADPDCAGFERVYPQRRIESPDIIDLVLERTVLCSDGSEAQSWQILNTSFERPAPAPAALGPVPPAPAQRVEVPAAIAPRLSVADFVGMWRGTDRNSPLQLIGQLDQAFDRSNGTLGGQSPVGNWEVPSGSLVWTDTQFKPVLLKNGQVAPPDKWVALRVQGGWGVFYAYDDLIVPTPGRSARTDRFVDPTKDLAQQ